MTKLEKVNATSASRCKYNIAQSISAKVNNHSYDLLLAFSATFIHTCVVSTELLTDCI